MKITEGSKYPSAIVWKFLITIMKLIIKKKGVKTTIVIKKITIQIMQGIINEESRIL